jgi:hypothetical protein
MVVSRFSEIILDGKDDEITMFASPNFAKLLKTKQLESICCSEI